MEWTNAEQIYRTLLSGGFGFLLGCYYELFRFFRLMFRSTARAIVWQDLLFFTTASVATFLFDLYLTGGMLRLYLFAGMAIGFAAYYFTVGRWIFSLSGRLIEGIRTAFAALKNMMFWPLQAAWRLLGRILTPVKSGFLKKYRKLRAFFSKKVLKRQGEVVYNQEK